MVARSSLILFALAMLPDVALAQGTQVPEAPSGVLFALGVAGVLIGRQVSRRRKTRD